MDEQTPSPQTYAALLASIKERIQTAQVRDVVAVNRELVLLYWGIGTEITRRQDTSWHLRDRILTDRDNQRRLDGIGEQMDCGRLLTFLHVPGVEPTNNRAERLLRRAMIARKVSQCSKNEAGAHATSAFLSVIQTAKKATSGVVSSLVGVIGALVAMR